jgi:hypothetical protein
MPFRNVSLLIAVCAGLSGCSCSSRDEGGAQSLEIRGSADPQVDAPVAPGRDSHPLRPALELAQEVQADIGRNVRDYTATLVKSELSGGKLSPRSVIFVKIRHKPFSVYACSLEPESSKGNEGIYVAGRNDGNLLGHTTGVTGKLLGTLSLKPDGMLAMQGQRYPITEIGMLNLCRRLIEAAEEDMNHAECKVTIDREARLDGRSATRIEVVHPAPRAHFKFHLARIFIDNQLKLPVRYESYDWPKGDDAEPGLIESYAYRDIKLNAGLTDADFDAHNPEYHFP